MAALPFLAPARVDASFAFARDHLADLEARARLRALVPRRGIDFASNDYLGLAGSARIGAAIGAALARGVSVGSGGSRLLRGNDPEHEALEDEAARLFGSEAALFFANGYAANSALLSTLPQRGDLIVHDTLVHASAHEGMRLSRAANLAVRHNDAQAFADAIAGWRREGGRGRPWIVVESLYSMDGDRAPLADLAALAARHDGILVIDEAHATGVFGPDGRGLGAELKDREGIITLHTCGKALGCEGALLCLPTVLRDFLVNRARGFIFTTAPSPLIAAAVRESLRILVDEPERRAALHALVAASADLLVPHGARATGTQIVPLVLGDDATTMRVAAALQASGYDVRGIRPPTVPQGEARLRIALTLNVTVAQVTGLGAALEAALR